MLQHLLSAEKQKGGAWLLTLRCFIFSFHVEHDRTSSADHHEADDSQGRHSLSLSFLTFTTKHGLDYNSPSQTHDIVTIFQCLVHTFGPRQATGSKHGNGLHAKSRFAISRRGKVVVGMTTCS